MSLPRRRPHRLERGNDQLLDELARQNPAEINKIRAHERLELKLEAELRPANLSAGREPIARGRTLDLSPGGCRARLASPPTVGDIYAMHLFADGRELPRVHALCLRTALVGESEVEAAFQFLSPLADEQLFAGGSKPSNDLLG